MGRLGGWEGWEKGRQGGREETEHDNPEHEHDNRYVLTPIHLRPVSRFLLHLLLLLLPLLAALQGMLSCSSGRVD
jgi:hypothetical protein